ncbi:HipA domain-containing protein [Treponema putidum]|uniref:Type II toxin-antitoxin system HipA family toxin n=1 Tax=Treponema putidum TaxID=221027 RepID=A0AAE9MTH6_9SPIR|nr:HipA domain-containing protein [Treponema putidum]UTY34349.1 type II toxin-antitoxin system HipA family toxin [Treponema putidum]
MNCLCCGKPIKDNNESSGWHKTCIKKFFTTAVIPEIEITDSVLEKLAKESTNKGYTIPGVQKKLSLHLSKEVYPRLTVVNYPTGYILKPQVKEFRALPEAEHIVMSMADKAKIITVPHALVKSKDSYAYITKRIDRIFSKDSNVKLIAMEDFCQLDLRLTQDKYKGSCERCGNIIKKYSSRSGLDMSELFYRLVFSFIVGNSDMHLKNFSLIESESGSGEYNLSPAYDLLPVNVIMPEDKEEFALPINGKKRNIHRKDFLIFAAGCGIAKLAAEKMIGQLISMVPVFIDMCCNSLMPQDMKEAFIELVDKRVSVLR